MTRTRLADTQSRLLISIKDAHHGTTDADIAAAVGCCRPHISDLRNGTRELGLSGLVGAAEEFGADVVLGPVGHWLLHAARPRHVRAGRAHRGRPVARGVRMTPALPFALAAVLVSGSLWTLIAALAVRGMRGLR